MNFVRKFLGNQGSEPTATPRSSTSNNRLPIFVEPQAPESIPDNLNDSSFRKPKNYYEDGKKVHEFVDKNFAKITRQYYHLDEGDNSPEHNQDLSMYFDEDDRYYTQENEESKLFRNEFKIIPRNYKPEELMLRIEKLEQYNKKISSRIKRSAAVHYDSFDSGLEKLGDIKKNVDECLVDVKFSRKRIAILQRDLITTSKKIVDAFKQKREKEKALKLLLKFRERFGGIHRLLHNIDEKNFEDAHEKIPIIKAVKDEFEHDSGLTQKFDCLRNGTTLLDQKLSQIEQITKNSLSDVLINFDPKKYESLLKCYYVLEKRYSSLPALSQELLGIIKGSVKKIKRKSIETFLAENNMEHILEKDATIKIPVIISNYFTKETFIKYLNRLYHDMSSFMYNNHLCSRYHSDTKQLPLSALDNTDVLEYYKDLKLKFLNDRKLIWTLIQKKVAKIIDNSLLFEFSYPELIDFLDYMCRFIEIGEDFSHSSAKNLRTVVDEKLKTYYFKFHEKNIATLRVDAIFGKSKPKKYESLTLEEMSQKNSPLSSFVLVKRRMNKQRYNSQRVIPSSSSNFLAQISPDKSILEMNEGEGEIPDDQPIKKMNDKKQEEVDAVVCPAAISFIQSLEKYLLYLDLMQPYVTDIFFKITYVFDLYFYGIAYHFIGDEKQALFKDIDVSTIKEETGVTVEFLHDIHIIQRPYKNFKPYLAKVLDLFGDDSHIEMTALPRKLQLSQMGASPLDEIGERVVAAESLLFVFEHLKYARQRMNACLGEENTSLVSDFFEKAEPAIIELREFIYKNVIPRTLKPNDNFFGVIPNMNWDIKDPPTELTNIYIDRICYHLRDFKEKLESAAGGSIPKKTQTDLLIKMAYFCFKLLVESYSKIKKINERGKQMLKSDLALIMQGIAPLFENKVIPHREYVEDFMNATNQTQDIAVEFIVKSKIRYPLRVLNSLFVLNLNLAKLSRTTAKDIETLIKNAFIGYLKLN